MLTDETPDVYLKRRRLAYDYFLQFPRERIYLNSFFAGYDKDHFEASIGLDCLKCDSVACLAGTLHTMPEYRERYSTAILNIRTLERFLGINPTSAGAGLGVFTTRCREIDGEDAWRNQEAISDWELGRRRLEKLVREAEEACKACPATRRSVRTNRR